MEIDFKVWKYINGSMHKLISGKYYDTALTFREWTEQIIKDYNIDEDGGFYDHLLNRSNEMNDKLKQMREHLKYLFDFMIDGGNDETAK